MIVLASQSAARRKILKAAGIEIVTDPAAIDEDRLKRRFRNERQSADDCAQALAAAKAEEVAARHPDALVIGADQILECGGQWFDKPRDRDAARAQLAALRGRTHELVSAVVVLERGKTAWRHVERARLTMRDFSDAFVTSYLDAAGDAAWASVGAYALEGVGVQLFSRIEGDYFAILGLPLLPLLAFLRDARAVPR